MLKINLLPPKIRKTKIVLKVYTYFIILGSVVAIGLIFLLLNLVAQSRQLDTRMKRIDAELAALQDQVQPLQETLRQSEEMNHWVDVLKRLVQRQPVWIHVLDELASVVHKDMWLTRLMSQTRKGERVVLTLEGEAYQKMTVADFLTALEYSRRFDNVKLDSLNEIQQEAMTLVRFKVSLGVVDPSANGKSTP